MPNAPTAEERVRWHLEHTKNCACRPFPAGLMARLGVEQRETVAKNLIRPEAKHLR
jgi:hypothetical protein